MKDFFLHSAFFGLAASILCYQLGQYLQKKLKLGLFNPLLIAVCLIIGCLLIFKMDYPDYYQSAKYLSYLLTPATVCLAIPLYENIELLKKNLTAILLAVLAGVISSMGSVLALALLFHFTHEQYVTLLPKSITTAIGIDLSSELGGYVTISIASIIITGILGNIFAEKLCRWFHIKNPIAKGLAIGTAAHAIGTAKAFEMGEVEGAMSSLAIVVAGLMTVIGASLFAMFF